MLLSAPSLLLAPLLTAAGAPTTCQSTRYDCVDGKPPSHYLAKVRLAERAPPRGDRGCLKRLRRARVDFRLLQDVAGVRTPIEVMSEKLGHVRYKRSPSNRARFILDCHTVEVLAAMGRRLLRADITTVYWSSAWRYTYVKGTKRLSEHARGGALDVTAIDGGFGYATVVGHYERGVSGCGAQNRTSRGKALRRFVCALRRGGAFGAVFTPDRDAIHRDHFHLERPDPRFQYRPKVSWRGVYIALGVSGGVLLLLFVGLVLLRRVRRPDPEQGGADA